MLKTLEKFCNNKNIKYSFTNANPILTNNEDIWKVPFSNFTKDDKLEPKKFFPDCKTVFVFLMPYSFNINNPKKPYIASGYSHYDYHKKLKEIIDNIAKLLGEYKTFQYKIQIDTGPLAEKLIARKSGLGQIGKNSLLINKNLGSNFFIGLLLVDFEMDDYPTSISENYCLNCQKCINACPTNALYNKFNYEKCISYLTQNKKLTSEIDTKVFSNHIFGCDICIKACPYNKTKKFKELNYNYNDFLNLSNKEFKIKYGNKGFAWQGNAIIKRNSIIAKNNE